MFNNPKLENNFRYFIFFRSVFFFYFASKKRTLINVYLLMFDFVQGSFDFSSVLKTREYIWNE